MSIAIALFLLGTTAGSTADSPVELGRVAFRRDHDSAFAEAKEADKPVLLLFQEIPG